VLSLDDLPKVIEAVKALQDRDGIEVPAEEFAGGSTEEPLSWMDECE